MNKINVRIQGIAPILQHGFAPQQLDTLMQGTTKKTGAADYSLEWMATMYVTSDGYLCQPASHIEGALVEAAKRFKIKGARGKTWKDAVQAYCYVVPGEIVHLQGDRPVSAPGPELLEKPTEHLHVDVRRVRVNRAAVARARLMVAAGWELGFTIEVHDDQLRPDTLKTILEEAGRAVGIGDYRPRFGRFVLTHFEPEP